MTPKIKITIVEDVPEIALLLEETIRSDNQFEFVSHYKNAEDALTFIPGSEIDILIADIGLPGMDGVTLVARIKELMPELLCIMYTVFDHDHHLFRALKSGANGYLLKDEKPEKIISAIKEIKSGGAPMSPSIARKVTEYFFQPKRVSYQILKILTTRENEILQLLAQGFLYKEIADQLGITVGTVKQHIHRMYQKMHVQNRTEAINRLKIS